MFGKKYNAKKAEQLASLLLERMGLSQEDAEISAKILITADLFGRQTHGLERGTFSLERLFAKEDKNRKKPLWKSPRLSLWGRNGIAVRTKWQSGIGFGNRPAWI